MADKNYLHTAYAYNADGTDRFTTVYPNFNMIAGTRDFSGNWVYNYPWTTNGTYKGLTVKTTSKQWNGLSKNFTIPQNGSYAFSSYVSASGSNSQIRRYVWINEVGAPNVNNIDMGNSFNWMRDSFVIPNCKKGDVIKFTYNISGTGTDSSLSVAGYKYEPGSIATPHMPSSSEVTTADWPKYVGTYVDINPVSSAEPSKYVWDEMKYRVYLDGVPVGGSKLLSFDLGNLKAGTSYNVQVSQINGNIESDKSESVAFKTTLTQ